MGSSTPVMTSATATLTTAKPYCQTDREALSAKESNLDVLHGVVSIAREKKDTSISY